MKNKFPKEIQDKVIVGIVIAAFSILFYFIVKNVPFIYTGIKYLLKICIPFIIGFAIAFLLNPLMVLIEDKWFAKWKPKNVRTKRRVSCFLTFAIVIVLLTLLIIAIVPTLTKSIADLFVNAPDYLNSFAEWLTNIATKYNIEALNVEKIVGGSGNIVNKVSSLFSDGVPSLLSAGYNIVAWIIDFFVGVFAAFYLLLDKEFFNRGLKKLNYAIFPEVVAEFLHRVVLIFKDIFYSFITGKAIDSAIIGFLCYIVLKILSVHYAILLAVIVGVTNMIPVFGPFIGAIPGLFILVIVHPIEALIFLIVILIIQQLDGNVIGPMIIGNRLNIGSFWILFSVTLGGALFGVLGMFIGVPIFALFYFGIKEFINYRLEIKNINVDNQILEEIDITGGN